MIDHVLNTLDMLEQRDYQAVQQAALDEIAYDARKIIESEERQKHTPLDTLEKQKDRDMARLLLIAEGEADRPKEMRLHQWQKVRDHIKAKWLGRETGLTEDQRRGYDWLKDASKQSLQTLMKDYP